MSKFQARLIFTVFILFLPLAVLITPASGQTTQPASPTSRPTVGERSSHTATPGAHRNTPYDFWTSPTLTGDWGGVRSDLKEAGLNFELLYNQQYQQNSRGGLRVHHGYRLSGSYDLHGEVDFGKMKLFQGLSFFMEAKGTWSDGINPDKVGALYNVNADAGDDHAIFVKKWWFKQMLLDDKIELRVGMLETNKDLVDVSLYANHEDKDFLNLMSIRDVTVPHRTGLGAFAKVKPTDWLYFQGAVVDAQARARRTGFDTAFHDDAWFAVFWEMGLTPAWKTGRGSLPGRYRVGGWYDPTVKNFFDQTGEVSARRRGDDTGFYLGLDQMVFKEKADPKDSQGLGLFSRLGLAHGDINRTSLYWQAGASYKGLIPTRDNDVFAFVVAQANLSSQYLDHKDRLADRETVYEWYYSYYLTPWCIISPDFQVVTNPGGDSDDRDAIIGGVRIRLIF